MVVPVDLHYQQLSKRLLSLEGQNCVIILADGVRNYMTKFVDERWMKENKFTGPEDVEGDVSSILRQTKERANHSRRFFNTRSRNSSNEGQERFPSYQSFLEDDWLSPHRRIVCLNFYAQLKPGQKQSNLLWIDRFRQ